MAVKAADQITMTDMTDVKSFCRYYLLQSSTLAAPSKPTTNPPSSSWSKTEPTYTAGSTNSLYFTDLTVFSNDTFSYSDVSLSSSYEAAKTAYNKAVEAAKTATNYIDYSETEGLQVGDKQSGSWVGTRTQQTASAFNILGSAGEVLASYGAALVELGKNAANAVIKLCAGAGKISVQDLDGYRDNTLVIESDHIENKGNISSSLSTTRGISKHAAFEGTSSAGLPYTMRHSTYKNNITAIGNGDADGNGEHGIELSSYRKTELLDYNFNGEVEYEKTSSVKITPESINLQSDAVTVNGKKLGATLLWTNPKPTSTFAKQNITMSESMLNFDFIMIEYLYDVTTYDRNKLAFARSGCETQLPCVGAVNQGERVIGYVNETTFEVGNANYNGSQQNRYAVPLNIYGFNMIF